MNKIALVILIVSTTSTHARLMSSGDIVARALAYPGAGWAGHVGMATGDNIGQETQIIIEALWEDPVIQINYLWDFQRRSPYWGSRYGFGDYNRGTRAALVEANHQRWWCPSYTIGSGYDPGEGIPTTGYIIKCGMFRCDTFIGFSYAAGGYSQIINSKILYPKIVFGFWPHQNANLKGGIKKDDTLLIKSTWQTATIDEINTMPFEQFAEYYDIPIPRETPNHIAKEWELLKSSGLNDIKKGIFIDRLSIIGEPGTIEKFIELYPSANKSVKNKLLQGMMIFYQRHKTENLKSFYEPLIATADKSNADKILRGYIDFSSDGEIIANRALINEVAKITEPHLLASIYHNAVMRSKETETAYFDDYLSLFKKQNNSDFDDIFFGYMKIGYRNLKNPESIAVVRSFVQTKANQYQAMRYISKPDNYTLAAVESLQNLMDEM
ncbi:MAG: hypothetical protein K2Q14_04190 [Gammaproteobacteria bacterium]|nr:hypothetical protein [Gammaproteobacteria bacterium]